MAHSDVYSVPRRRLALLCHLVRWSALAWVLWALAMIVIKWGDTGRIARMYGHFVDRDLSALPAAHHAAGFLVVLLVWATAAAVVVFLWRLFGHYLRGNIFSAAAASELQRLGWAGVLCVCADILARALLLVLLTMHLESGRRAFAPWIEPNDLLHAMMALFVVALATIFKTGVAIADDHRQFV
jgi:hypothetical protein